MSRSRSPASTSTCRRPRCRSRKGTSRRRAPSTTTPPTTRRSHPRRGCTGSAAATSSPSAAGARRYRVVDCEHKVPCVGFAFSSVKRAIKPEFEALKADGRLLAAKRREGVEIDHEVATPLFAFLGDTRPDVFARSPWLLDYPVVVTECTFLDDDQLERARRIGHTVWSELRPIVRGEPGDDVRADPLQPAPLRPRDRRVLRQAGPSNVVAWAHPASTLPESYQ